MSVGRGVDLKNDEEVTSASVEYTQCDIYVVMSS